MEMTIEQMVWHSTLIEMLQNPQNTSELAIQSANAALDAYRAKFNLVDSKQQGNQ